MRTGEKKKEKKKEKEKKDGKKYHPRRTEVQKPHTAVPITKRLALSPQKPRELR